jgi:hypothetical protein
VTVTGFLRYLGRNGAVGYEEPRRYRYSAWHSIYRALLGCFGRGRTPPGGSSTTS